MITESMMYWITRLDGMNVFIGVSLAVCVCAALISGIAAVNEPNEGMSRKCISVMMRFVVAAFVLAMGLVFTPTTKEMAMIYAVPAISRSDLIREDIPELYELGVEALKEKLKGVNHGHDNRAVRHRA